MTNIRRYTYPATSNDVLRVAMNDRTMRLGPMSVRRVPCLGATRTILKH